jgi:hypothetical protein
MTMKKRLLVGACSAVTAMLALAAPAGAQELVDAGQEGDGSGGLAFVLMTVMVFVIGLALFFMDRIRRRATEE